MWSVVLGASGYYRPVMWAQFKVQFSLIDFLCMSIVVAEVIYGHTRAGN